jgi:hypothetical protein
MVPLIARAASPQALLSLRCIDGTYFRISFSTRRLVVEKTKLWPGGPRPTLPGLVSPCDAWWWRGQIYGRGDPGQPCRASYWLKERLTDWVWVTLRAMPWALGWV